MNKERNYLQITKPILIFCIILILCILMSCSKTQNDKISLNVNKNNPTQKTLVDTLTTNTNQKNEYEKQKTEEKNNNDVSKYFESENKFQDLSNIKNTYYGKYNLHGEDVLGSFEVTRNAVIFTPDDGNSREIIHFSGIKNIDRVEYPNGKIDLLLQYDGYEKSIKNVSDEMFSDVLLYTTK